MRRSRVAGREGRSKVSASQERGKWANCLMSNDVVCLMSSVKRLVGTDQGEDVVMCLT